MKERELFTFIGVSLLIFSFADLFLHSWNLQHNLPSKKFWKEKRAKKFPVVSKFKAIKMWDSK